MNHADCIFCNIITKKIPATFIEETPELLVIKDIAPKAPIHLLIISKKHIKDMQSLTDADAPLMASMMLMAKKLSEKYFDGDDFRLVVNSGYKAGQRVFHLHFHVLSGKTMEGDV